MTIFQMQENSTDMTASFLEITSSKLTHYSANPPACLLVWSPAGVDWYLRGFLNIHTNKYFIYLFSLSLNHTRGVQFLSGVFFLI